MSKKELPSKTLSTAIEGYGRGYARTTGRFDWWSGLDMNFYSKSSYALECYIEEPHIVIDPINEISIK